MCEAPPAEVEACDLGESGLLNLWKNALGIGVQARPPPDTNRHDGRQFDAAPGAV
jgi:hypothetical protein